MKLPINEAFLLRPIVNANIAETCHNQHKLARFGSVKAFWLELMSIVINLYPVLALLCCPIGL